MKRFKRVISVLFAVFFLFGIWPTSEAKATGETLTYDEVTARIAAYAGICAGRYWNGDKTATQMADAADRGDYLYGTTTSACSCVRGRETHLRKYGCTSNKFCYVDTDGTNYTASQCYGFSVYMAYVIFGQKISTATGWNKEHKPTALHPGDVIRYSGHSIVVWYIEGSSFYTIEGNIGSNCKIATRKYPMTVSSMIKSICNSSSNYVWESPAISCKHSQDITCWSSLGVCNLCKAKDDFQATEEPLRGRITPAKGKVSFNIYSAPYSASTIVQKGLVFSDNVNVLYRYTNCFKNVWYKVEFLKKTYALDIGTITTGYVYSENVQFIGSPGYVEANVTVPKTIFTQGDGQEASGTIFSTDNPLSRVSFGIYNPDGTPTQYLVNKTGLSDTSYRMTSGDDSAMKFSALAPGKYYYLAQGWDNKYNLLDPLEIDQQVRHCGYRRQDFYVNPRPQATTFSISFNGTGGTGAPSVQKVAKGSSLYFSTLPVPQSYGYIFAGWSTEMGAETPDYTSSSVIKPNNDMKLYAVWNIIDPPTAPNMRTTTTNIGAGKAATITWDASAGASNYEVAVYTSDNCRY